jgi:hypothetical protein
MSHVDRRDVSTNCRGMTEICDGLFVDDKYIKWLVTLLALAECCEKYVTSAVEQTRILLLV